MQEPAEFMDNLLHSREAAQNSMIYRYIVTTMRLKIMLFLTRIPTCSLRLP